MAVRNCCEEGDGRTAQRGGVDNGETKDGESAETRVTNRSNKSDRALGTTVLVRSQKNEHCEHAPRSGEFNQQSRRRKGGERNVQYDSEERNGKAADESRITVAQKANKDVEGERKEGTRWDSECGHPMCPIYHARTTSAVVVPRTAHCERFPRGARNSTAL